MGKRKLQNLIEEHSELKNDTKYFKLDESNLELRFSKEKRLSESFFDVSCLELAKNLLGKYLVRSLVKANRTVYIVCKIVEVEAYLGGNPDSASHSFNNKKRQKMRPCS